MTLTLHAYQKRAVEFCLDNPATYLAMDMGLGKTAVALTVIKKLGLPAFVFAPLRPAHLTWPDEIALWAPELSYYVCHGPEKSLYGLDNCDIIIMNYEGLAWFSKQSAKWRKRVVVFDEASMFKSHSTSRFKMLKRSLPLWHKHKMLLSATPTPNTLGELWAQYYIMDKGETLGKNISTFRNEYCSSFSYPGMTFTKYTVRPEMEKVIYDKVAPTMFRLKVEDYLDMPELTYNNIMLEMPTKAWKAYLELEKLFVATLDNDVVEADSAAALSMKLRQIVQGGLYVWEEDDYEKLLVNRRWEVLHDSKLKALVELMEITNRPILCAIQFKAELEAIRKKYPKAPVIAGGTDGNDALKYIRQWNKGELPLLLCHPASLSHGVNLQHGGHTLLWYGLTWSLEQYTQLNGRLYRQGQKEGVVIHHLIIKDTIDEAVLDALQHKHENQEKFLNHVKHFVREK